MALLRASIGPVNDAEGMRKNSKQLGRAETSTHVLDLCTLLNDFHIIKHIPQSFV